MLGRVFIARLSQKVLRPSTLPFPHRTLPIARCQKLPFRSFSTPPKAPLSGEAATNTTKQTLLDTKALVEESADRALHTFNAWRRQHTVLLLTGGTIVGASLTGLVTYFYFVETNPRAMEKIIVNKTIGAFGSALNFEVGLVCFLSQVFPSIPHSCNSLRHLSTYLNVCRLERRSTSLCQT